MTKSVLKKYSVINTTLHGLDSIVLTSNKMKTVEDYIKNSPDINNLIVLNSRECIMYKVVGRTWSNIGAFQVPVEPDEQ